MMRRPRACGVLYLMVTVWPRSETVEVAAGLGSGLPSEGPICMPPIPDWALAGERARAAVQAAVGDEAEEHEGSLSKLSLLGLMLDCEAASCQSAWLTSEEG